MGKWLIAQQNQLECHVWRDQKFYMRDLQYLAVDFSQRLSIREYR